MTSNANRGGASAALARAAVVVPWAIGLAVFGFFAPSAPVGGFLCVALGVAAVMLTAFGAGELGHAPRTSAVFWECTARNAWIVGALAAEVFFVRALSDSGRGLAQIARGMALSFLPALYGLALAGLFAVPALRMRAGSPESPRSEAGAGADRWFGVALFVVLVAWAVMRAPEGDGWRFAPWATLLHWPAVLVVIGAALLVAAIAGEGLRRRIGVVALALAGLLGLLAGLVMILLGFADQSLARVVSGLSFALTSSFAALAAMLIVANPIEDRRVREGGEPFAINRAAWFLLPAATIVFLVIALLLAMTPMQQKM